MSDSLDFNLPFINQDELVKLAWKAAQAAGVNITFSSGSNPHFHIHIGELMAGNKGNATNYTDQSTGPTGAKSFGPDSSATSHGSVVQGQSLNTDQILAVTDALNALIALLDKIQTADRTKLEETLKDLNEAKEASYNSSSGADIASPWTKAKEWINAALAVGMFASEKAEQVRELVARITEFVP